MFGSFILIPQLVQMPAETGYGFAASVTEAGLFLLPSAAVMLVAGPLAGALGNRYGSRVLLVLGTIIATAAFALLAVAHDERWEIYLAGALMGVGIGFSFAAWRCRDAACRPPHATPSEAPPRDRVAAART